MRRFTKSWEKVLKQKCIISCPWHPPLHCRDSLSCEYIDKSRLFKYKTVTKIKESRRV